MMRRLVTILAAALLSVLSAAALPAGATPAVAPGAVLTYTYNAPIHVAPETDTAQERGPPVKGHADTTYDAADLRSHGISVRHSGPPPRATYAYDDPTGFGQVAWSTGTTAEPARWIDGDLRSFPHVQVAANTGKALEKWAWPPKRGFLHDPVPTTLTAPLLARTQAISVRLTQGVRSLAASLKARTRTAAPPQTADGARSPSART